MSPLWIRPAISADLPAVGAIYAHAVHTSTATFDVAEPPLSSWQAKLDSTGLGSRLYGELVNLLRHDDVHLVVAVVAQPNLPSNALHAKLGFTEVGTLDEVGFKFGAYVSTTAFQLRLS
jgi:L-amino acid N-acyltransferase YncA